MKLAIQSVVFTIFVTVTVSADSLPLRFFSPDDAVGGSGVTVLAMTPEPGDTLLARDESRPKLWFAPAAALPVDGAVRIWYQRVNAGENDFSDQRTLCVGEIRAGVWSPLQIDPGPPAWGGVNNVCMRRSPHKPTWGGFNVFQIVRDQSQYRMLYWDQPADGEAGAMLASSSDGLTWTKDPRGAVFTEHNDAYTLIQRDGEYLLYQTALENWPDKPYPDNLDKYRRVISLRRSPDLVQWSPQQVFLRPDGGDAPETEFYLFKVFAYSGKYLGLLMKYYGDPDKPKQHSAILKHELLVSDDAVVWQRPFRDTDLGFWSYADPFPLNDALHFAIWKDGGMVTVKYPHGRLTGVHADDEGVFTTRPFPMPRKGLLLDADTENGWLVAQPVDAGGEPIRNLHPIRIEGRNAADIPLHWRVNRLHSLVQRDTRLKILLHKATLYAVRAVE